jgi:hypothetical protein
MHMDATRKSQLAKDLNDLGLCFWAGEAEICRQFWGEQRSNEEQTHWLRLQVYKEMYGSGLVGNPGGIIRGFLEDLRERVGTAETSAQREDFERSLRVLREEYNHFKLFADVLESVSGEPIRHEQLKGWQIDADRELQQVRQSLRESAGDLAELAIAFTEGGGSAFFLVGQALTGDPVASQIAKACKTVYMDELEHGEHGALELEKEIDSEEDWVRVREMIVTICQQRLRMRYEMFGLPVDEARILEITEGKIEPLPV